MLTIFQGGSGHVVKVSDTSVLKVWTPNKISSAQNELNAIRYLQQKNNPVVKDYCISTNVNVYKYIQNNCDVGVKMPFWKYNLEKDVLNKDTAIVAVREHLGNDVSLRLKMVEELISIVCSFKEIKFNHGDFKSHNMQMDENYQVHVIDFDHSSFENQNRNKVGGQDDYSHLLRRIVQILMMVSYDEIYIECDEWCEDFDNEETCCHTEENEDAQEHLQNILENFVEDFPTLANYICEYDDDEEKYFFYTPTNDTEYDHLKNLWEEVEDLI